MKWKIVVFLVVALSVTIFECGSALAVISGHYLPGVMGIRDIAIPEPGVYYMQYNLYYQVDKLKNKHGNSVDTVTVNLSKRRAIKTDVDFSLHAFATAPVLAWIPEKKILGANFGFAILDYAAQVSFDFDEKTKRGYGIHEHNSTVGLGDPYIRPIWLGWHFPRFDVTANYGVWLPFGRYKNGSVDNIGRGFTTHMIQMGGAYYLTENKASALTLFGTYEINGKLGGADITPGQRLSIEWGFSQFLSPVFAVGVTGYSNWEVTRDHGMEASPLRDRVHGIGGEINYLIPKLNNLFISVRHLQEYEARSRTLGHLSCLTFAYKF